MAFKQPAGAAAEKAATKGAADAQFLVYAVIVSMPELNYFDAQGRFDAKRYAALAARPISQREDEMVAYDMLGKAALQGYPDAQLRLAGFYADNVGEGNRKRAEELLDKMPKRPPLFDGLRKALGELDAIGPKLLTVRLADEAIPAASRAAQAAAAEKDKSKAECKAVKPARAQRMGPVSKPIWLPLAVDGLKTAYLMSGEWRERWTFDVCGAETVVQPGRKLYVEMSFALVLDDAGSQLGSVAVARDVTERVEREKAAAGAAGRS